MNKRAIAFIFVAPFFVSSAFAERTSIITLEAYNHRGVSLHKDVVIVKDSSITVNNETLSPTEIITQSSAIKSISTFKSSESSTSCESGSFRHRFIKDKIDKVETGCLNNDRYNELQKSFMALKKDTITQ